MENTHFPDRAVVGEEAVYLLLPGLEPVLKPIIDRLSNNDPVEADAQWYFGRSADTGVVVVMKVAWDTGDVSYIGFAEQHWPLLPEIVRTDVVALTYELTPNGETPGVVPLDDQGFQVRDLFEQLELIR